MILEAELTGYQQLTRKNGRRIMKVKHLPSGLTMVQKGVPFNTDGPGAVKKILEELRTMASFQCKYLVAFYDARFDEFESSTLIYVEYMDKGSFDKIYRKVGPLGTQIVAKVALAVLEGMSYLYDVKGIVPRNIKPSNMMCNSRGDIKICDFVVSEELINSIPETFVSTSFYISPERIEGSPYTIKADVWSLGISLVELALGRFPFAECETEPEPDDEDFEVISPLTPVSTEGGDGHDFVAIDLRARRKKKTGVTLDGDETTMGIIELLQFIISAPSPRLSPENYFPKEAHVFVDGIGLTPKELLGHDWIRMAGESNVDMKAWASSL
ncbi:kinase [Ephemerocybe angulata]|uniref:Kinase n=1 Tax=Ephemerocybe angulata TaxID=980116 RepID=A0A8H6HLM4_9AGAR|nr:kinase [Tulosesus angulatus]